MAEYIAPTRPGFKHTELGWIPEDWEVISLGETASKDRWSFVGGPFGSNLKSSDYTNTGIRILQLQNIGDGVFLDEYAIFTSVEKADELISSNIYGGEIILSKMGDPVARACLIPDKDQRYLMCSDGIRLKVDQDKFDNYFVLGYINSPYFRQRAENASIGSTRKRIGLTELRTLTVISPTLAEQQAIATALSDTDVLIASLQQLIAKKQAIKQGAMQQLLTGKTRVQGFEGSGKYKQTEVGLIPEEWVSCQFQDVLTGFSSGMTPFRGKPEYYKGSTPWITSGELNYNVIIDTYEKITQRAIIDTNLHLLPIGTFLMAITGLEAEGTRGSCAITGIEATTNQSCMALFPIEGKIETKYLFHFYVMFGSIFALKYCQGTKQQSYTGRIVKILPIVLPPTLEEQQAIAQILSDMDAEIEALTKKKEKCVAMKQGMMQELLTGKTRLPH